MDKTKGWDLLIRSVERQNRGGADQQSEKRAPYGKPEKLVERAVMEWSKANDCFFHVVESKAVWSVEAQRFVNGQAESGYPDLSGNNNYGHSMWIELKAAGKRSNLSPLQYIFLKEKIEQGCFAVVVDSTDKLNEYYYTWLKTKNRQAYLLSILPVPSSIKKSENDIDPALGF